MELIALIIFVLVAAGGTYVYDHNIKTRRAIPTKYDPHYTRKLEQQEFGYILTTCNDDACQECFPKAIEPPKSACNTCQRPMLTGYNSECFSCKKKRVEKEHTARNPKCRVCKVPLDSDGWCSNGCVKSKHWTQDPRYKGYTQKDIDFQVEMRKIRREHLLLQEKIKKSLEDASATPIVMPTEARYRIINRYRVRIPDRVPTDAYCQEVYDPNFMRDMLIWKWTDSETGKSMFYKSPASFEDEVDYVKPIELRTPEYNYEIKRPRAIGTERIRK